MAAVACLRVTTPPDLESKRDLGPLISKFTAAFLEARWRVPRQHAPLSLCSFLLTDPTVQELDPQELGHLSHELQARLFGQNATQAVTLLLFEGPAPAIGEFAAMPADGLRRALDDHSLLPEGGRLSIISGTGERVWVTPPPPDTQSRPPAPPSRPPCVERFHGIYFPSRQLFVADMIACTPISEVGHFNLLDGEEHFPQDHPAFDADCTAAAARFFTASPAATTLHVPISFSSLVRPSERNTLVENLALLPPESRPRLSAVIYGVPREPSFQALAKARQVLDPYFHGIDLQIDDPNFAIEQFQRRAVTSITFALPSGDQQIRVAAMKRFASKFEHYKRRLIWPAVTNIRTRVEIDLATQLHVPFLTGPGICPGRKEPIGGRSWPLAQLPVGGRATYPSAVARGGL